MRIVNLVCALTLTAPTVGFADECSDLSKMQWIVGKWVHEDTQALIEESWQITTNQTLEGAGVTYSNQTKAVISSEDLLMVEMQNTVFLLAKVESNTLPVAFKLERCGASIYEFVNPEHDFPNRLTYRVESSTQLTVDVRDNQDKGFTLNYLKR